MARIFLIEIDLDFADCLRNIFESEGFEVDCASNISEAIISIADFNPAVTIVNMQDGDLVTPEHVKFLSETFHHSPILVTANYKSPELACKALGVGACDYLLKPFSSQEIIERVHNLAGTGKSSNQKDTIEQISDSIRVFSSYEDILKITIDQLSSTMLLTDCLLALRKQDEFRIIASRGYEPDPVAKTIRLTEATMMSLKNGGNDPISMSADLAGKITEILELTGHRPFPTIMPLVTPHGNGTQPDLLGFVLGHGALVVEENDILEMERFLSRITEELIANQKYSNTIQRTGEFELEREYLIPQSDRETAISEILDILNGYLNSSTDKFWIRLVLDEAVNNAIIHGHGETLGNSFTNVRLTMSVGPEILIFRVEDSGDGFNYTDIPDPTADENILSINGRGIFLMRNIMDDIIFNEKGNIVSLIKHLDGSPLGPSNPGLFDDYTV